MNNIKLHLGIIAFLVIGLVAFYMTKDDVSHYKNVYEATYQIQRSNEILVRSSEHRIKELEEFVQKYPHAQPLYKSTRQIRELHGSFYEKIGIVKEKIFEIEHPYYTVSEEEGIVWNKNINYPHRDKSKKATQLIFKEAARELVDAYHRFESSLITLLKDTTNTSQWEQDILQAFQAKNIYLRDSSLNLLRSFEEERSVTNSVREFDILHCLLFLTSCQQELYIIENKLINSYHEFALASKTAFQRPNKYAIIMSPDRLPIVGKPFNADFFVTAYVDSDDLRMRVNGQEIPVKNGMGTYSFTPKRSGDYVYKVDISYRNSLTGRFDNYSKTFRTYVP